MSNYEYELVLSEITLQKIILYKQKLVSGQAVPGKFLKDRLDKIDTSLQKISTEQFINILLSTKKITALAECEIQGMGKDWQNEEIAILGDLNVTMSVQVFDNGTWEYNDRNFKIYDKPLKAYLLFTPGILLNKGSFIIKPPDMIEVTLGNKIIQSKYNTLVERRLGPLLSYANAKAKEENTQAFIAIPGIGCGIFAGQFKGRVGEHLNQSIENILHKNGENHSNIACIYFDSFNECTESTKNINGIKYVVRPKTLDQYNPILTDFPNLPEFSEEFSKCKLFKLVAWDHISFPGNDYFKGHRNTDDGVSAAATNSMEIITGIKGEYNKSKGKYLPPAPYKTWEEVIKGKNINLDMSGRINIVTTEGQCKKLDKLEIISNNIHSRSIAVDNQRNFIM